MAAKREAKALERGEIIPAEPEQTRETVLRQTGRYEVARLAWAFHTVALSHPDTAALDVLASVTGNGRSSPLVKRWVEEKNLFTDAGAWSYTPQYPGFFAVYADCKPEDEVAGIEALRSEVEQTTTDFFMPSSPRSFSMNSRTSRPRSPMSAITVTSASVLRTIWAIRVDLPPPAAAKMPIRCPSPQVSIASSARNPSEIGLSMTRRSSGFGGSA